MLEFLDVRAQMPHTHAHTHISALQNNNRVRIVAGGVMSTFAGTGVAGAAGLGGLATDASMRGPSGVAIDAFDNVYISDSVSSHA